MSKKKKLFVFDLDGTLLNSQTKIDDANVKALMQAREKGHVLAIATGRNYLFAKMVVQDHWNLFDYYLGCNAALFHDIKNKKYQQSSKNISYQLVTYIINKLETIGGGIQVSTIWNVYAKIFLVYDDQAFIDGSKKAYFENWESPESMSEKERQLIVQVSLHVDHDVIKTVAQQLQEEFGQMYDITITSRVNIDINLKGLNKLFGIKAIAEKEAINPDYVYVFGDSQNDHPGLEFYKNTYAVENGLEETKKIAKNVIGSNDTDAIAKVVLKNI